MLEKFSYAHVCCFVLLLIRRFPLLFPGCSLVPPPVLLSAAKIPVIKRCTLILKNYFTKEIDKKDAKNTRFDKDIVRKNNALLYFLIQSTNLIEKILKSVILYNIIV